MSEEREKVRCRDCELVQWKDRSDCRRCGSTLPQPIEKIVEKVVFGPCSRCAQRFDGSAPADAAGIPQSPVTLPVLPEALDPNQFPTMAEVERRMILAAYQRSNRRPLEAARLLGIGKTTMYRKLREMNPAA